MNLKILSDKYLQEIKKEQHFLSLAIEEMYRRTLLSEKEIQKIQHQILQEAFEQAEAFSMGDTSIPQDELEIILEAINYTISFVLRKKRSFEEIAASFIENSVGEIYQKGKEMIQEEILFCRAMYKTHQNIASKTVNQVWNDTMIQGITAFFQVYSYDRPQHSHVTFDYPVFMYEHKLTGIELLQSYLTASLFEELFYKAFDMVKMEQMIENKYLGYLELILSRYEVIASHFLVSLIHHHVTVNEPLEKLDQTICISFCELPLEQQRNEIKKQIQNAQLFAKVNIRARKYFYKTLEKLLNNIAFHVREGTLENICFIKNISE